MNTNANSLTTSDWLKEATARLEAAGIATARLDCLILLEDATQKDRSYLLAHPEYVCQGRSLTLLNGWVERRINHEPLAYIRGKSEFYGRTFQVTNHTLEPRPETETIIDVLKNNVLMKSQDTTKIIDVGTGSGCIAISCKLVFPNTQVYATDIDKKCIEVANKNARTLQASITIHQGNLLAPVKRFIDNETVLLANLPYVPNNHTINPAAMHEPKHAIFGGADGLELYRELFEQVKSMSSAPRYIITESLPTQHTSLKSIAKQAGYKEIVVDDFIQLFCAY